MHKHTHMHVQPGAVKLVLWRQWIHQPISLHQAVQVTSENQFHCTRLYTPSVMQPTQHSRWEKNRYCWSDAEKKTLGHPDSMPQ